MNSSTSSRFGNVERLRHHTTSMSEEDADHRMYLQQPLSDRSVRNRILNPVSSHPERHESNDAQARRNGQTFKVLGFAAGVLGDVSRRDVEASQACESREDEDGQKELVEGSANADRERTRCGSDAERDLGMSGRQERFVRIAQGLPSLRANPTRRPSGSTSSSIGRPCRRKSQRTIPEA